MGISSKGFGTYTEIMNTWTIADYLVWLDRETEIEDARECQKLKS